MKPKPSRSRAGIYSRRAVRRLSGAGFRQLIREKEIDLILIGLPRNMDGSYGPAAEKVQTFVGVLGGAITVPIKMWDEGLTWAEANRVLIQGGARRGQTQTKGGPDGGGHFVAELPGWIVIR